VTADAERALGSRRYDAVRDVPASRLADLVERFPELADRVVAERGKELLQL
jgi:hypothetical protein